VALLMLLTLLLSTRSSVVSDNALVCRSATDDRCFIRRPKDVHAINGTGQLDDEIVVIMTRNVKQLQQTAKDHVAQPFSRKANNIMTKSVNSLQIIARLLNFHILGDFSHHEIFPYSPKEKHRFEQVKQLGSFKQSSGSPLSKPNGRNKQNWLFYDVFKFVIFFSFFPAVSSFFTKTSFSLHGP
jgi:hypothetical protein